MVERLGIIILNYKNYYLTINALNSVRKLSPDIKVVIVDNDSQNESEIKLKERIKDEKNTKLLKNNKNGGYAKGNNLGIHYLLKNFENIEYIGVMNPDVEIISIESIDSCLKLLSESKEIASITPVSITNNKIDWDTVAWKIPKGFDDIWNSLFIFKYFRRNRYRYFIIKQSENNFYSEVEVLPGSFFIIKKSIFEQISFFDEKTFLYCEERILGKKIKDLKKKQIIILNSFYTHNHAHKDSSFKENLKHLKILFESRIYFNKNYNGMKGKIVSNILKIIYPIKVIELLIRAKLVHEVKK